jgi:hypothetical protein
VNVELSGEFVHFFRIFCCFILTYLVTLLLFLILKKGKATKPAVQAKAAIAGLCLGVLYSFLELYRVNSEVVAFKAAIIGLIAAGLIARHFSISERIGDQIAASLIKSIAAEELGGEEDDEGRS